MVPIAQYIPFTEEQKLRAGAVDLEEFLHQRGETLIRSGRDKRLASDRSVTVRGNEWYDHATQRGGGPIAFVQRFYNKTYPEAVTLLLGGAQGTAYPAVREKQEEERKPFELPPANLNMRRVYAYLMKQRSIDKDVISHFAREELLYEDAEHHNCVFVGTDEQSVPRHAHLRSTNSFRNAFRINVEGSNPRYSFHHIGRDGSLFVFEAPIDMMSYITLRPHLWQEHSYVACCGTSIQPVQKMLERMPRVDTVFLCLDNDKAGHEASKRFTEALAAQGVETERLLSERKDWNEDLVAQRQTREVTRLCQTMCCP